MSIESKHAYRFGYLKSEKWKTVRLEALVREKGKCQICGEESISNDAHHIWYPKSIYDTTEKNLVVLCRACHSFVHQMVPECKTNDEEKGIREWNRFRNAIFVWRQDKSDLFLIRTDIRDEPNQYIRIRDLRTAYDELKRRFKEQRQEVEEYKKQRPIMTILQENSTNPLEKSDDPQIIENQIGMVLELVKSWGKNFKQQADSQITVDKDNLQA
jgi:hypothetical protein